MGTRYNGLGEAVLTSTHNVCFESKIRKNIGIPLRTPVLLIYFFFLSRRNALKLNEKKKKKTLPWLRHSVIMTRVIILGRFVQ